MKALSSLLIFLLISFFSVAHTYTVFEENGKVGLKNAEGKVLIPAEYNAIGWSNGKFSLLNNVTGFHSDRGWGLINLDNEKVTAGEFAELYPAEGSLLIAKKKSGYSPRLSIGCINTAGKEIIPFLYDGITVSSLRAVVFTKIGNHVKYGLIDLTNKTLIPQQYQHISSIGTLRYAVRNFEGKTALFTENGKQITDFTIDSLSAFKKGYAVLYQGIHKGLIDREGQVKIEPTYRDIMIRENGSVVVREPDEWFFLDGQNHLIRQVKADSVVGLANDLLKVETSQRVQLTNAALSPVGDATFTQVGKFSRGKALYQLGDYYGVITRQGNVVVPALYHQVIMGKDFILANQRSGIKDAWILFDTLGTRKIQQAYEALYPFTPGYFAAKKRGYWGLVTASGQESIACVYDSLIQGHEHHVVVKFKGLHGIISLEEEWKVTPKPNPLFMVNEDRYLEYSPSSTLLKSMDGNVIYFSANPLTHKGDFLYEQLPSGNTWKIDLNGVIADRQVIEAEKIYEEAEGYRAIKRNGRYGFIDTHGRLRIANRYEAVQQFSGGFAAIKILGKWGFVNQHDNIAVQPVYEEVWPFKYGHARVKQKGLYGLINTSGKQVLPVRYESIDILPTKNLLIEFNGQKGLADEHGKILIHPRYNTLEDLGNNYIIAERDGKYGVITEQGISTIPMLYDYIAYDVYNNLFFGLKKTDWVEVKL